MCFPRGLWRTHNLREGEESRYVIPKANTVQPTLRMFTGLGMGRLLSPLLVNTVNWLIGYIGLTKTRQVPL